MLLKEAVNPTDSQILQSLMKSTQSLQIGEWRDNFTNATGVNQPLAEKKFNLLN